MNISPDPAGLLCCLQVSCVGQIVCAVLADTRAHAKRGAAAVKIGYEDLPDPIFTTEVRVQQTRRSSSFTSRHILSVCATGSRGEVVVL